MIFMLLHIWNLFPQIHSLERTEFMGKLATSKKIAPTHPLIA